MILLILISSFSSSSFAFSASKIICLISSFVKLPFAEVEIWLLILVFFSIAVTVKIPSELISKITSTLTSPFKPSGKFFNVN